MAFGASGCSGCASCLHSKTDAERAAEERKEADEVWQSSFVLLPWRAIKGAVRSRGAPNRPEIYVRVDATLAILEAPPPPSDDKAAAEKDARLRSDAIIDLLTYLALHRSELAKHDEDEFPRFANLWEHSEPPLPAPWYDDPAEHLVMALGVLFLDAIERSDRVPARDIVFYELSRAPAQPSWPAVLRVVDRYARGVTFVSNAFYYAADEELTGYIADVEKTDLAELAGTFATPVGVAGTIGTPEFHKPSDKQTQQALLALGYFTRAYNRSKLERDDAVTEDLSKGLEALRAIGVDNELTLWAQAYVDQRAGRYEESARSLDRLSESPYLDDDARKEIREAAVDVRKHAKDPGFFHRQRTTFAIVRALVARGGGPENVLAMFVGRERAHRFFVPLEELSSARERIRDVATKEGSRIGGLREGAAESTKKAWESVRDRFTDAGPR